jgi:hypothetical protein
VSNLNRPGFNKRVPRVVYSITSRFNGRWAEIEGFFRGSTLGLRETLARATRERLSIARFGDGELWLALDPSSGFRFQGNSPELNRDLRALLRGDDITDIPLLVCIPGLNSSYYRHYWAKYWPLVRPLLNPDMLYGDASVSREPMFRGQAEAGRLAWRSVWAGRDVCYVTGRGSRFDPTPELFDNVASERRVYSEPRNAYSDLPRLIEEIEGTIPRETLILIALGPAATLLAAELARRGFWAIDLGHVTSAYSSVVHGARRAEHVPLTPA